MIPRIFHRIWIGGTPMPAEFKAFGASWSDLHPGWEMWDWYGFPPELLESFQNVHLLHKCRNHAQTADLLRYELLWAYGGVYLDTDFICQKNIEPLLLADATFVGAGEKPNMLSAGFIAAEPRHPLIGRCRDLINERIDLPQVQAHTTGPGMITEAWQRFKGQPGIVTYGPELFYPYPWNEKHRRHEAFPDAYAIHHWAGSWL